MIAQGTGKRCWTVTCRSVADPACLDRRTRSIGRLGGAAFLQAFGWTLARISGSRHCPEFKLLRQTLIYRNAPTKESVLLSWERRRRPRSNRTSGNGIALVRVDGENVEIAIGRGIATGSCLSSHLLIDCLQHAYTTAALIEKHVPRKFA